MNALNRALFRPKSFTFQLPMLSLFFASNMATSTFKGITVLPDGSKPKYPKVFTNEELKERLTKMQYYVTQEKGTERPFSGEHVHEKDPGVFSCVVCGQELFSSKTKYESGSGWPSFWDAINSDKVNLIEDNEYGMKRIEVTCSGCGSHLGHVFNDGPKPTGIRYCINSASLDFDMEKPKKDDSSKNNEL